MVLGAAILNPQSFSIALDECRPEFFSLADHAVIWRGMQRVNASDKPLDLATLKRAFIGSELDEVGGPAYLGMLVDGVPRSSNIRAYLDHLRELAGKRAIIAEQERAQRLFAQGATVAAVADSLRQTLDRVVATTAREKPRAIAFSGPQLVAHRFPARRTVFARHGTPVIQAGHIVELFAPRGIGKSLMLLSLGVAAATGRSVLGFDAAGPMNVTIIDGEMASDDNQQRLVEVCRMLGVNVPSTLTMVAADWQDGFMPRLDTREGQNFCGPYIDTADLVIIDNRSCLFDPEGEVDPVAWQPAQEFLLSLRRRGKAVIVAHHSNRQGGARGISKPEDCMDMIIGLKRPEDYTQEQGARFIATFDKSRSVSGLAVAEFEARLLPDGWAFSGREPLDPLADVEAKLLEYVRVSHEAGAPAKGANDAIAKVKVKRINGLKAWKSLVSRGEIAEHPDGYYHVA